MEKLKKIEKKNIKLKKEGIFVIGGILLLVIIIIILISNNSQSDNSISDTLNIKNYENKNYYVIKDDYKGKYDLQIISLKKDKNFNDLNEVMDYSDYKNYCNENNIKVKFSDTSKNYIVYSYLSASATTKARLAAVDYIEDEANLYLWKHDEDSDEPSACIVIVPTDKNINSINIIPVYTKKEFKNIEKNGSKEKTKND